MSAWEKDMEKEVSELKEVLIKLHTELGKESGLKVSFVSEQLEKLSGDSEHDCKYKRELDEVEKARQFTVDIPESWKINDGEKLNPHLQCDGECYDCDDNIPSHGSVPNQCGRIPDSTPPKDVLSGLPVAIDLDELLTKEPSEDCKHIWGNTNLDEERGIDKTCIKCGHVRMKKPTIEVEKADLKRMRCGETTTNHKFYIEMKEKYPLLDEKE